MADTGTGTVSNVGTDSAAADAAPDAKQAPKTAEDWFEVLLDGQAEPIKIPADKLPLEKLNPYVAKKRAEADRRLSEADKKSKELAAKEAQLKYIDRIKANPDELFEVAKELGIKPEKLYEMNEREVARKIQEQLARQEEEQHPDKKLAREREEFDKDKKEFETKQEAARVAEYRRDVDGYLIEGLTSLPGDMEDPAVALWKTDVAEEMTYIVEDAMDKGEEIPKPRVVAQMAKDIVARRYEQRAGIRDNKGRFQSTKAPTEEPPKPQPKPVHPAASQTAGTAAAATKKANGTPPATEWGLKLLRMPK